MTSVRRRKSSSANRSTTAASSVESLGSHSDTSGRRRYAWKAAASDGTDGRMDRRSVVTGHDTLSIEVTPRR